MSTVLNINLPKWPALVVVGKKVTEAQAAEILVKTDTHLPDFEYAGNDRKLRQDLQDLFGIPNPIPYEKGSQEVQDKRLKEMHKRWAIIDALRQHCGKVGLEYLSNDRIVSSWIGGPHGWCDWNGTVFCNNYNIGKYPSVKTVETEWKAIAAAFPFLSLKAWLYSGETGEENTVPVVRFDVWEGKAEAFKHKTDVVPSPSFDLNGMTKSFLLPTAWRESGISPKDLEKKLALVYGEDWPKYNPQDVVPEEPMDTEISSDAIKLLEEGSK